MKKQILLCGYTPRRKGMEILIGAPLLPCRGPACERWCDGTCFRIKPWIDQRKSDTLYIIQEDSS